MPHSILVAENDAPCRDAVIERTIRDMVRKYFGEMTNPDEAF
jgi:hypothetical protein